MHNRLPGKKLTVSKGTLFCQACREELNFEKRSVKNHVLSTKHREGKKKLQVKQKHKQDIAQTLQKHNAEVHQVREMLQLDQQVITLKLLDLFLEQQCL